MTLQAAGGVVNWGGGGGVLPPRPTAAPRTARPRGWSWWGEPDEPAEEQVVIEYHYSTGVRVGGPLGSLKGT